MKKLLLVSTLLIAAIQVYAQSEVNMAIVDFDAALERHPKYEFNMAIISTRRKQLEAEIDTLSAAFNFKLQDFQASYFDLSETEKKAAEQELSQLEQVLNTARENYGTQMQEAENTYIKPLETNVQEAINTAANQKGFNFVTSAGLFYVADSSRDITTLVIEILSKQ